MSSHVNIELLQQYLAGEIAEDAVLHDDGSPVSKDQLENAVKEFEEIALDVEGAALKSHLQDLHQTLDLNESRTSRRRWLAIAASIIVIGVFGALIWQNSNRAPVFSDYFDHFDQLVTFRDSDSTSYSVGLEAYSLKDYDLAYLSLQSVDNLSDELKFYLGVSALGSSRPVKAVQIFEQLDTASSYKYYQQVRWYLGLAHWQSGDSKSAIDVLSQISKDEYQYKESLKLIEQLKD